MMPGIALMTTKIDGATDADGKVGVDLDQAFVIALIIIITRPRLPRHELHIKSFTRRQVDVRFRPPFALGNRCVEDRLHPILGHRIILVKAIHPCCEWAVARNELF